MGKSTISMKTNFYSVKDAYNKLFRGTYEVTEATEEKYFYRIPKLEEVNDIELGCDGTNESILRLNNNGFVVVNKTIETEFISYEMF